MGGDLLLEEKVKTYYETDSHPFEMICLGNSTSSELSGIFLTHDEYMREVP